MATVVTYSFSDNPKLGPNDTVTEISNPRNFKESLLALNLGTFRDTKRFWFSHHKGYYFNAIATQQSFDDPKTAENYQPREDWKNAKCFNPSERWTWAEGDAIVRKIDIRVFIFACFMFMALELDHANFSQALTDNFLEDLGMNTNGMSLIPREL